MKNEINKYSITISEPWDFKSSDGKNKINGIISIVNKKILIFKTHEILNFDGVSGNIIILSPRFKDVNFDNLELQKISVNGGLLLDNNIENENELKEKCKFVIIGTLEKVLRTTH